MKKEISFGESTVSLRRSMKYYFPVCFVHSSFPDRFIFLLLCCLRRKLILMEFLWRSFLYQICSKTSCIIAERTISRDYKYCLNDMEHYLHDECSITKHLYRAFFITIFCEMSIKTLFISQTTPIPLCNSCFTVPDSQC